MNRSRTRVVNRFNQSQPPMYVNANGEIFSNVTSIIGDLSNGLGSIFGAIQSKNQKQMLELQQQQQQYLLSQKNNNWVIWAVGGLVVVVVLVLLLRK